MSRDGDSNEQDSGDPKDPLAEGVDASQASSKRRHTMNPPSVTPPSGIPKPVPDTPSGRARGGSGNIRVRAITRPSTPPLSRPMTTPPLGSEAADREGKAQTLLPSESGRFAAIPASSSQTPSLAGAPLPSPVGAADEASASGAIKTLVTVPRSHYESLDELARDEHWRVMRARDRRTDRIVAVKETRGGDEAYARKLESEALLRASLQHTSIPAVYELARWTNGEPFYAMKLVTGRSLADALRGASSLAERLAFLPNVAAVASAIAYAHEVGVTHGALDSACVRLGDHGETMVLGWGTATRLDEAERDAGSSTTVRSDLEALGALLHELIRGVRTPAEPSLPELPDLPPALAELLQRTSGPHRHATPKALAADLRKVLTSQLAAVVPVAAPPVAATPVAATPVAATPVAATPIAATPIAATPIAATPVAATPIAATPIAAAPVAATHVAATPVAEAPAGSGWRQWIGRHPGFMLGTVVALVAVAIAAALH